ncbi:GNAT family N-acetyltransferase [Streptomyces sp. CA-243310]|uniref:GNAT family N-acetyltransferase n=1 Tax=Streptomyces sp. CA-243310 TaxID=3240056 RepID=UPI003D8CAD4E
MTTLLTERLLLAPLDRASAEHLVSGAPRTDDRWGPGYPDAADRAGAERFLRLLAERGGPGAFGAYEIRRREDGVAIGGAGFHGPVNATGRVTVGFGLIPARTAPAGWTGTPTGRTRPPGG